MSFLTVHPEIMAASALDLQGVGAQIAAANAAVATPTTGVMPASADEVSALAAAHFVAQAQMYQAVSAQASATHQMFVTTLGTSAESYAAAEVTNTALAG